MDELSSAKLLIFVGLALGLIMGATARAARFCTFGAVEDYVLARKTLRLKAWALAIAIAMIGIQFLHHFGLVQLEEATYLSGNFGLWGAVFGGLLFGLGMSMVGTCGYGVLVRMAGGDLKALCSVLVIALSGYMAARGITSVLRTSLIDSLMIDLSSWGGQGIPHLLAQITPFSAENLWLPVGLVLGSVLLFFCFRDEGFRSSRRDIVAGCLIGLCVVAGFYATGTLGTDPFDPVRVQSLTYVLPLGDTIMWMATFSGASISFSIAVVLGTVLGAFAMTLFLDEWHWEGFDDMREMRRHLAGAAAMGTGGITAIGCTVGQGISGISTLSMSSPIALLSIFVGASFGLHWLLTGSAREALAILFSREVD